MILAFTLFCLGWGFFQAAYDRVPASAEPGSDEAFEKTMQSPFWASSLPVGVSLGILAILAAFVGPIVGYLVGGWPYAIAGYFVPKFLVSKLFPSTNPAVPVILGCILTPAGTILLVAKAMAS